MEIAALRAELRTVERVAYFQTGTLGPVPTAALRAAQADMERVNDAGPGHIPHRAPVMERIEAARRELSRLLGCRDVELGFTQNTSHAINLVALALPWEPGDEVIISDAEHKSNVLPWRLLQELKGIRVTVIPAADPSAVPDRVRAAIGPRTRLVSLCHVSCSTGAVLPVAEVCALARQKGVLSLVDGAQAVGVIPVNVRDIGCDFYAGSGHKWLLGLPGIGFLYVRQEMLPGFVPLWAGPGSGEIEHEQVVWTRTASKIEVGTRDIAVLASLTESLAFIDRAGGVEAIARRVADLRQLLRTELARLPEVEVLSPSGPAGAAGITTFRLVNGRGPELAEFLLHRHRVVVRNTGPTADSVRVSTHFFNTESEVHQLLCGLLDFLGPARGRMRP